VTDLEIQVEEGKVFTAICDTEVVTPNGPTTHSTNRESPGRDHVFVQPCKQRLELQTVVEIT
jgi:hypothetical protein